MVHSGYIGEQVVYLVWLVGITIAVAYYMFLRKGNERNNELARWFYRLDLALCALCYAMCYDYRGVYDILPPAAGIWLLASCTNLIFTGMSVYLFITLRTLHQTAGRKIGGLAEEDERRVRKAKFWLIVVTVLLYIASYARCIVLIITKRARYDSYFLWFLALGIFGIATIFEYSAHRLSSALMLHSQSFDLTPQIKRLKLIVRIIAALEVGVLIAVCAAAAYIFVSDKAFGEVRPDEYQFKDFMGGVLHFIVLLMMTAGVIAPYKGGSHSRTRTSTTDSADKSAVRTRTVSRFAKPGSTGSATAPDNEMSTIDSRLSSPAADLNDIAVVQPARETSNNVTAPLSSSESSLRVVHEQYELVNADSQSREEQS